LLCDVCGKNPATVHLTEIIEGKIIEVHLCEDCAKKKTEEFQKQFNIADFLSELVDIDSLDKITLSELSCPNCGLSYEEFKNKGRLGCAECYSAFKDKLTPLLRKIHGSLRHRGKVPKLEMRKELSREERIKELKQHLERAVRLEEYEEAARIRDEIKQLEAEKTKKNKRSNKRSNKK